jgi:hypothetical protein
MNNQKRGIHPPIDSQWKDRPLNPKQYKVFSGGEVFKYPFSKALDTNQTKGVEEGVISIMR